MKQLLVNFLDSVREYEHESGNSIYKDERESEELVDIFLQSNELKWRKPTEEDVGKMC